MSPHLIWVLISHAGFPTCACPWGMSSGSWGCHDTQAGLPHGMFSSLHLSSNFLLGSDTRLQASPFSSHSCLPHPTWVLTPQSRPPPHKDTPHPHLALVFPRQAACLRGRLPLSSGTYTCVDASSPGVDQHPASSPGSWSYWAVAPRAGSLPSLSVGTLLPLVEPVAQGDCPPPWGTFFPCCGLLLGCLPQPGLHVLCRATYVCTPPHPVWALTRHLKWCPVLF